MNSEVSAWLRTATDTKDALEKAIAGFQALSNSYENIRNVGYKNDEKEAIDMHYHDVNDLRGELCQLQAGGRRRGRGKKTRRSKALKKRKASTKKH
jgi:hypothetical protein